MTWLLAPFTLFGLLFAASLVAEWVERTIHSWGAR